MRLWLLFLGFALGVWLLIGGRVRASGYSYSFRTYYGGSYSRPYPSYSYPYYGPSPYPAYGYYSVPYQSVYQYVPDYQYSPAPTPEALGYTYYPDHMDGDRRYPAGYYRFDPNARAWLRYGVGIEQGVLPNLALPNRPPVAAPGPKMSMPGADPTPEEVLRIKRILEILERERTERSKKE